MNLGKFPFGQPVRRVEQNDRNPRQVFVLGVYSSAVHARWLSSEGKELVKALSVASEPWIFWCGENTNDIVSSIDVPDGVGSLEPAACRFNGPSGRSLDDQYLEALGVTRAEAWLCDLVPHSCMNDGQRCALKRNQDVFDEYSLERGNRPPVRTKQLGECRIKEIAAELSESEAKFVITLGDYPLKWFASKFGSEKKLGTYGLDPDAYGRLHDIEVEGRSLKLLPLTHPHNAARIPPYRKEWADRHEIWVRDTARGLL